MFNLFQTKQVPHTPFTANKVNSRVKYDLVKNNVDIVPHSDRKLSAIVAKISDGGKNTYFTKEFLEKLSKRLKNYEDNISGVLTININDFGLVVEPNQISKIRNQIDEILN